MRYGVNWYNKTELSDLFWKYFILLSGVSFLIIEILISLIETLGFFPVSFWFSRLPYLVITALTVIIFILLLIKSWQRDESLKFWCLLILYPLTSIFSVLFGYSYLIQAFVSKMLWALLRGDTFFIYETFRNYPDLFIYYMEKLL